MKILIVDDDAGQRALLRRVLGREGHSVLAAEHGQQALDLLAHEPVDAVISDVAMPRIDGFRLCVELRRDARWRHLPFILHSATHATDADARLGRDLGADAFLPKPTDPQAMFAALHAARDRSDRAVQPSPHDVAAVLKEYGERLVDNYFWLRQKDSPAVLAYLKAESAYTDFVMKPTQPIQDALYKEMLGHIQETDRSVAYRDGEWLYYFRTEADKQYPI